MKLFTLLFILISSSSVIAQQPDTMLIAKPQQTGDQAESKKLFVTLGGKPDGDITAEEAKNSGGLVISRNDFRVGSFHLSIKRNGELMLYEAMGDKLTNKMISELGRLKPGDSFIAEEIHAYGNDGVLRLLAPLYFKIK